VLYPAENGKKSSLVKRGMIEKEENKFITSEVG
jgi:hypothetical protein